MGIVRTFVGTETLTPGMRHAIEHGFGAPAVDVYGCHECVFLAMQRPGTGTYRVCEESVILEVLKDGEPAKPGDTGDVVVTALHSFAMPFIRYRLGDRVTLGDPPRDGDDPFLALSAIDGRSIDRFVLSAGRTLHAYALGGAIEGCAGVRTFQVIQNARDGFHVRASRRRKRRRLPTTCGGRWRRCWVLGSRSASSSCRRSARRAAGSFAATWRSSPARTAARSARGARRHGAAFDSSRRDRSAAPDTRTAGSPARRAPRESQAPP